MTSGSGTVRILGPQDGEHAGTPGVLHDRFLGNAHETDGRFAIVEHLLPPRAIAAPLHRHHHEDEYSFILAGRVGVLLGGELTPEAVAIVGQRYSVDVDFEGTGPVVERHGLTM